MNLKTIDLLLTAGAAISGATFAAYLASRTGTGLFAALPDGLGSFFIANSWLQWVALAVLVGVLAAKIPVSRTLKQRRADGRD